MFIVFLPMPSRSFPSFRIFALLATLAVAPRASAQSGATRPAGGPLKPRIVTEPTKHDTDDPAIWIHRALNRRPSRRRESSDFQQLRFSGSSTLTMKNILPLTLTACAVGFVSAAPDANSRPNILVIITDQQSADAMSHRLGDRHLKTPHMDSLAKRGVSFTRAYSANPICIPSRTSMLTGRYPHETGVLSNDRVPFDPTAWPTIGTLFKAAGYTTGYIGKWHLPYPITNPASGFDSVANIRNNGADAGMTAAAAAFLGQKHEKPFLFFASFNNPHNWCRPASTCCPRCVTSREFQSPTACTA